MSTESVAVIGSGVAGCTAAYLLRRRYDVTLFEALPRLGGHADTQEVRAPDGSMVAIDTGFIVHNRVTYPLLSKLFAELRVPLRATDMSMSISCRECGLEYAGGKKGVGLAVDPKPGARTKYLHMLAEIPRFFRAANTLLDGPGTDDTTFGPFLAGRGFSRYFTEHFAQPFISAVWSAGEVDSLRYPARYLFTFLRNHGLLAMRPMYPWQTVQGGSRVYIGRIAAALRHIHSGIPVRAVRRHADGVEVVDDAGTVHSFDRVVVATHADQALTLLADPTVREKEVLGAFSYSRNRVWLHTDASVLPGNIRARASWNHLKTSCRAGERALVSYHMNRLMRLSEPVDYIVTLNGMGFVDEASILAERTYEHPVCTLGSVAAQRSLPTLTGQRIAFSGAYHGWGFHEDGCVSGLRAARAFGVDWP